MRKNILSKAVLLFAAAFLLLFQTNAQSINSGSKNFTPNDSEKILIVKTGSQKNLLTVVSKNSTVSEITAELSRQLKIPFALSRVVKNYQPTLDFKSAALEKILPKLAPFVIVDNELSGKALKPEIKGIYLFAYNESIPAMADGTEVSNKQTFIFEGNTETYANQKIAPNPLLQVKYQNRKLSVSARQQLLIIVAGKIAEQLGVPLSVDKNPQKTVSIKFENLPLEQAFRQLPSNLSLKYRITFDGSPPVLTEMILK